VRPDAALSLGCRVLVAAGMPDTARLSVPWTGCARSERAYHDCQVVDAYTRQFGKVIVVYGESSATVLLPAFAFLPTRTSMVSRPGGWRLVQHSVV
jgi:hypothetical protein